MSSDDTRILYLESSALVRAVLNLQALEGRTLTSAGPSIYVASELTFTEAWRTLRCVPHWTHDGAPAASPAQLRRAEELLQDIEGVTSVERDVQGLLARVREPMELEPMKTLDALHLASVLGLRQEHPTLELFSRDKKLRAAASSLGVPLLPLELDEGQ